MSALTFAAVCCSFAESMDGWRHEVKTEGALERHVWWWKDRDFALGVIVAFDHLGPLMTWKVRPLSSPFSEVEGSCSTVAGGTVLAVDCHAKWVAERKRRGQKPRAQKTLPAEDSTIPF